MPTKTRPAHVIRVRNIKGTIWANDTSSGVRHNLTVVRLYKDGTEWKTSESFGLDDLPKVARVVQMAEDWILRASEGMLEEGPPKSRQDEPAPAQTAA